MIDIETNMQNANQIKEALIHQMVKDGIFKDNLTEEQLSGLYVVVIHRRNMFGKVWAKLFQSGDDSYKYTIMKTGFVKFTGPILEENLPEKEHR